MALEWMPREDEQKIMRCILISLGNGSSLRGL